MPAPHRHKQATSTRRSPLLLGRCCLFVWAACFLKAAPLGAQTSGVLNYVDHINVDFDHTTVLQTNIALRYHDRYGDLQGPSSKNENDFLYFFSTRGYRFLNYTTLDSPTWSVSDFRFLLTPSTAGSEVSYTPIKTGHAPPTNGPFTIYDQFATMTGTRNAIYGINVDRNHSDDPKIHTMVTDPPLPPYSPGNALLAISDDTAILTLGNGSIATVSHPTDYNPIPGNSTNTAPVTPLISAQGSGPGELNNPSALAIGPDKLLYVLDAGNNRIQKFTADTGEYRGGFDLPTGMTVFTTAVTSDGNGGYVYHGDGTDVLSTSMAISSEGHIYLGDGLGGGFVFDLNGNLLTNFQAPESDGTWVNGALVGLNGGAPIIGVGSFLQYDGVGNVFTYVEGKGFFMYRDPSYDELDYVNLTVGGNQPTAVTSGPGVSVVGSLSFRNDLSQTPATLTIVDPLTVRTGNIYVQHDEWGRDSTGIINGGTLLTAGDMHKINGGTLILNNVNTYTGRTIVDDGKLIVNGSIAGDAVVTDNATLGGHGVIGGNVLVEDGGTLSPGNSPGLLTIDGDLTLSELSTLLMEFGGTGAGLFDQLTVLGLFNADGTLSLQILDGYTPVYGDSFQLFTEGGIDFGNFTNITTNLGDGLEWDTSHLADEGKVTVVPEPSTYALLSLGLGVILLRFRVRRRGQLADK